MILEHASSRFWKMLRLKMLLEMHCVSNKMLCFNVGARAAHYHARPKCCYLQNGPRLVSLHAIDYAILRCRYPTGLNSINQINIREQLWLQFMTPTKITSLAPRRDAMKPWQLSACCPMAFHGLTLPVMPSTAQPH